MLLIPTTEMINYIEPKKWNSLLKEEDTKIIDVRKPFEYQVGTFKGAKNPNVNHFREIGRAHV